MGHKINHSKSSNKNVINIKIGDLKKNTKRIFKIVAIWFLTKFYFLQLFNKIV